ncbi:MAG TPA: IS1182 family transposase [Anaerolineales bacterium]|nr:IS1182 family transposase [Anaerolineales bacterium]
MLSHKAREFKQHQSISLEDLVPDDNFYRQVEQRLDLTFVRELVSELYSNIGRASIDPVVFFKLQLIAFFEGIRSERQLMETVNLNLAHRWFIGYDLDEPVPDHSSLSKIRERFGLEVFQLFFERIVELCIEAGLVWGEELYFDSTKLQANANVNGMIDRTEYEAQQHLEQLFEHLEEDPASFGRLVAKYKGKRITGVRKPHYRRITDDQVSPTDPDAAPMQSAGGGSAVLGYRDHYVVDGGKARIILSALVTPASITDNTPLLDLVDWVRFRWRLEPKLGVGDTRYGTVPNIVGLEERGIRAYLPISDFSQRTKYYSAKLFQYDSEKDYYVCPQGQILPLTSRRNTEQVILYRAKARVCNACPLKSQCTGSKSGRHIFRSFFQEVLDKAEGYRQTEAYLKAMRKRSVWVEPLFGEAKEFHRLRRFRLRRLRKVNIEGVMVAAGQNLKRLIQHHLARLFSFLKIPSQYLISPLILTFSTG